MGTELLYQVGVVFIGPDGQETWFWTAPMSWAKAKMLSVVLDSEDTQNLIRLAGSK